MILTCIHCKQEFSEAAFYKNKQYKSGYASKCKSCYMKQNSVWENKNPDKRKQYRATYNASDKGKQKNYEYNLTWSTPEKRKSYYSKPEYKEKAREREQRWRDKNREAYRKRVNAWWRRKYQEDPKAVNAQRLKGVHRRRAKLAGGYIEDIDPLVVLELDDGICQLCGDDIKELEYGTNWCLDHIVPLSRYGYHAYFNVQLAHVKCNASKRNKLIEGTF